MAEIEKGARYDILFLDVLMPGESGINAAAEIRNYDNNVKIIFLTSSPGFAYESYGVRALDYLLKPYEEQELILSVEEALNLYQRNADLPERQLVAPLEATEDEDPAAQRIGLVRENIERYIRKHYTSELSMQDVAKAMNYSEAYFCKLFKQCFKVNFSAWLNEFRVEKAKEMLLQSRMSIREISLACGYTDANYFARVFKRITGKTPSEFRLH
jgi:YesN/AraC family two-component response regulator